MSRHNTDTPRFSLSGSRTCRAHRVAGRRGVAIVNRVRSAVVPTLVAMVLAMGCGEGSIEPDETPPDLTGTYQLVSLQYPNQPPATPPNATGTFAVRQTAVEGQEANGTVVLKIAIVDPAITIDDQGTYKNRYDGSWEQRSEQLQTKGTYTLSNDTLTVMVTEPALAVSTTVWRR